jgi:thioredoxin-related protein
MENFEKGIMIFFVLVILIACYYATSSEKFASVNNTSSNKSNDDECSLYLFFSDHCGHCHNFKKSKLESLSALIKKDSKYKLNVIDSNENTQQYFNQYEVQYVPAGRLIKGDKVIEIDLNVRDDSKGEKIHQKILEAIKDLN